MFLVKSALPHFERRLAIRNTWGSEHWLPRVDFKTTFLLGACPDADIQIKIHEEDSIYNLSFKPILRIYMQIWDTKRWF